MDNVTHSLAGLLIAEVGGRIRARQTGTEPSNRFRAFAAISSLLTANLPDADLLYSGTGGERLGYMLHHRGHTHTVIGVLLGAVLMWGTTSLIWRWRARSWPDRGDTRWLFLVLLVSSVSHIVLDWTNSYGVHPFWPFNNRWIYGDSVFIVEPWLWVVTVPALVAAAGSRVARVLLSLVLLAGLGLAWRVDLVSAGAATVLTIGAVLSVALARVLSPGARASAAAAGWVAVTLIMAAGAASARAMALQAAQAADPSAEILDIVVSPLPTNPVCLMVITVERSGATYRVSNARVSAAPSIAKAEHCGSRDRGNSAFRRSRRPSTPAIQWDGVWTAPSAELATLARESCPALAALRFIRVPIWRLVGDTSVMMGDIRYGGGSGNGFTDVRVPRRSASCPPRVPPWTPPRADLLGL
jgi:inner membrane protein